MVEKTSGLDIALNNGQFIEFILNISTIDEDSLKDEFTRIFY